MSRPIPTLIVRTQTPTPGDDADHLASFAEVALVLLGLSIFVLLVLAIASRTFGGLNSGTKGRTEIRGLGLPRGSVRAIIALLIIGSFVALAILGDRLLTTGTFDKVLASFGTLTGAVSGFYFGARTGQDLEEDETKKLFAAGNAKTDPGAPLDDATSMLVVLIRQGASGPVVRDLQNRLLQTGFYTGGITGTYEEATATAVTLLQQGGGLPATGVVDAATFALLPSA